MSGRLSGVQVRIKEHAECAENVHCYAHRLNLVIVDTCKAVRHAADYFALLQKLYIFVSGSFVHPKWLSLQNDLYPDEKPIELRGCQTRGGLRKFQPFVPLDHDSASL